MLKGNTVHKSRNKEMNEWIESEQIIVGPTSSVKTFLTMKTSKNSWQSFCDS